MDMGEALFDTVCRRTEAVWNTLGRHYKEQLGHPGFSSPVSLISTSLHDPLRRGPPLLGGNEGRRNVLAQHIGATGDGA